MTSFLVASACVVFVLSPPISATKAGLTFRRWAGVLFLLALAQALFVGLVGAMSGSSGTPQVGSGAGSAVDVLGTVLGFLILSPLAYGIRQLRKRFIPKSLDPWTDYVDL